MAIDPALGIRLIYLFGTINIIGLVLVLLSCRCMLGRKVFSRLMERDWYRRFFNLHCYYWWIFIISVLIHTFLAFQVFGNPF